ncbi:DUF6691 family protein [Asticcacaulis benevestitus]|uniref:YeeE/YedE family protein n=1 Tax=Asticcacaulis benevestitus DSM 16100 = ATCC BAA-896 TaxID=1121022 RepID=V4PZJ2_9CAUL|nr:DUF6691 family protein [Asticcacaulis benevestitus]ESQ90990.1 hypothetical protein ABENE_11100 [Asticcacaulis benevestitus DSM 16100 = ATCC BAA-896]
MKALAPLLALVFGGLFGIGLIGSGMIDTNNVKGFLDIAGEWRPALAFVMGGAVIVALPLFWWTRRRTRPLVGDTLEAPPAKPDLRLGAGAAIFGVGWGLSGICPGPAIVWLGFDPLAILPFIGAVLVGAFIADTLFRPKA